MKYNKKISDFLFDMITRDDYPYISNFGSQEDLNDYFGFEVPLEFGKVNQEELNVFVDNWTTDNKFSVEEDNIVDYDLDKGYLIRSVV